jgi:tRNA-intron endonuclease
MQPFTAVYSKQTTFVPTLSEADSLFQDGYGFKKGILILDPFEVLYNVERGKIRVINEENKEILSFQELLTLYSIQDKEIWIKFIVYRDLRTRGFVTRKSSMVEAYFEVYERGTYHIASPRYLIYIITEGSPQPMSNILSIVKENNASLMETKLAVVDRRGEIIYYSVNEKELISD